MVEEQVSGEHLSLESKCPESNRRRGVTVVREQVSVGSKCCDSKCPGSKCRGSNCPGCTFHGIKIEAYPVKGIMRKWPLKCINILSSTISTNKSGFFSSEQWENIH
jgi:hypothetical protein